MTGLAADPLDPALVRVRDGQQVLGAGFLVAPEVIATCAHVVGDADSVIVDFSRLGVRGLPAQVVERDEALDVAILRLDDPPAGALPVPARISGEVRDHRFRTFGFPRDMPDGVWVTGRLVGAQAAGRIQMAVDPDHWAIEPGFSGAPVWDQETGDVVGMVVTTSARNRTTAHLVPTTALGEAWTSPTRNPYRGLRPFTEVDAELFHGRDEEVDKLVEIFGEQRIVAVAGPSGSGKSSLVKAGLLPRVDDWLELRPEQEIPEESGPLLVLDQFEEAVIADPEAARQRLARLVELGHHAVLTLRSRSVDDLITKDTAAELNRAVWFLEPMSPNSSPPPSKDRPPRSAGWPSKPVWCAASWTTRRREPARYRWSRWSCRNCANAVAEAG
nr:serine protease [Saccharopolyspora dendranthemae]